MATESTDNLISLAAVRAAMQTGSNAAPVDYDYRGVLFEWREIGDRLAPADLAYAVGCLRGWPAAAPPVERGDAAVYPFRART